MAYIRFRNGLLFILIFLTSCGEQTITETVKIKVDTFINSLDSSNHSELNYLLIGKNSTIENRVIVKIPTNNDNEDDLLKNCFENSICSIFFMPITILVKILTSCSDAVISSANLTSAILIFNTNDGSTIPNGVLKMSLLAKPWWHSVNWTAAHPFSSKGLWKIPGGDTENSFIFDDSCTNLSTGSCSAGEVKFELTSYFKSLIDNSNSIHYGMLISTISNLTTSKLYSAQSNSALSPRIVATYTGTCSSTLVNVESHTKTFYLNQSLNN